MKKLMNTIFESLSKRVDLPLTLPKEWEKYSSIARCRQYVVYLAVANDTDRAKVVLGKGSKLINAINNAVKEWFESSGESFEVAHVKLDIVTNLKTLKRLPKLNSKITIDTGNEGLTFHKNFKLSFSPQELEAYGVVEKRRLKRDKIAAAHTNQVNGGDLSILDKRRLPRLYKFTTDSFYVNKDEVVPLIRGHRTFDGVTKKDLEKAIKLAKNNYFNRIINKKGKQVYSYIPKDDLKEKRYNILRHAGTIYSMLETIELFGGDNLLKKCERSLHFMVDLMEHKTINGKDALVLVERDILKLGGNALALVALAKYTTVTEDKIFVPIMRKLATWIVETQADNGDFLIHKQTYSNEEISSFRSNFYTGEAILGLVRLYELDPNEAWLDAAEKATDFLVNEINKGATLEDVHFDHWLLYGINNLSRYRSNDSFIAHAKLIGESLFSKQFLTSDHPAEWIGGFPPEVGTMPKSVPVACRSEGLANIYELVKTDNPEFASRIKATLQKAVEFQMQMQMRNEKIMYFDNKRLLKGSFYNKFKAIEIRNDFTQHNISAMIALYKILDN